VLKNYRRYRDRYRKSIGDTTDIDTFIAILTTLAASALEHSDFNRSFGDIWFGINFI
jgi:hypothetical protein